MQSAQYEAPSLSVLGSLSALTLQPSPPGKNGPVHDGSRFLSNFSCVVDQTPGTPCGDR